MEKGQELLPTLSYNSQALGNIGKFIFHFSYNANCLEKCFPNPVKNKKTSFPRSFPQQRFGF